MPSYRTVIATIRNAFGMGEPSRPDLPAPTSPPAQQMVTSAEIPARPKEPPPPPPPASGAQDNESGE